MAISAGISATVVEAIRTNEKPILGADDERLVYEFVSELLETRTVSQSTYNQAEAMLGRLAVVDLVGIVGYYCLVSITLNVFDMPLPKGEVPPLSP
tara:strand:- start:174 stop:461 length:288 start_codon:yes stop_codon:yes gene_type:complete